MLPLGHGESHTRNNTVMICLSAAFDGCPACACGPVQYPDQADNSGSEGGPPKELGLPAMLETITAEDVEMQPASTANAWDSRAASARLGHHVAQYLAPSAAQQAPAQTWQDQRMQDAAPQQHAAAQGQQQHRTGNVHKPSAAPEQYASRAAGGTARVPPVARGSKSPSPAPKRGTPSAQPAAKQEERGSAARAKEAAEALHARKSPLPVTVKAEPAERASTPLESAPKRMRGSGRSPDCERPQGSVLQHADADALPVQRLRGAGTGKPDLREQLRSRADWQAVPGQQPAADGHLQRTGSRGGGAAGPRAGARNAVGRGRRGGSGGGGGFCRSAGLQPQAGRNEASHQRQGHPPRPAGLQRDARRADSAGGSGPSDLRTHLSGGSRQQSAAPAPAAEALPISARLQPVSAGLANAELSSVSGVSASARPLLQFPELRGVLSNRAASPAQAAPRDTTPSAQPPSQQLQQWRRASASAQAVAAPRSQGHPSASEDTPPWNGRHGSTPEGTPDDALPIASAARSAPGSAVPAAPSRRAPLAPLSNSDSDNDLLSRTPTQDASRASTPDSSARRQRNATPSRTAHNRSNTAPRAAHPRGVAAEAGNHAERTETVGYSGAPSIAALVKQQLAKVPNLNPAVRDALETQLVARLSEHAHLDLSGYDLGGLIARQIATASVAPAQPDAAPAAAQQQRMTSPANAASPHDARDSREHPANSAAGAQLQSTSDKRQRGANHERAPPGESQRKRAYERSASRDERDAFPRRSRSSSAARGYSRSVDREASAARDTRHERSASAQDADGEHGKRQRWRPTRAELQALQKEKEDKRKRVERGIVDVDSDDEEYKQYMRDAQDVVDFGVGASGRKALVAAGSLGADSDGVARTGRAGFVKNLSVDSAQDGKVAENGDNAAAPADAGVPAQKVAKGPGMGDMLVKTIEEAHGRKYIGADDVQVSFSGCFVHVSWPLPACCCQDNTTVPVTAFDRWLLLV